MKSATRAGVPIDRAACGLHVILRGRSRVRGDERVLEFTAPMFDGRYEYQRA